MKVCRNLLPSRALPCVASRLACNSAVGAIRNRPIRIYCKRARDCRMDPRSGNSGNAFRTGEEGGPDSISLLLNSRYALSPCLGRCEMAPNGGAIHISPIAGENSIALRDQIIRSSRRERLDRQSGIS